MSLYRTQAAYFQRAYRSGEHGWPVEGPEPFLIKMIERFRRRGHGGRALDVGCGEGRHTYYAAEQGYRAVGVDYEPLAIRRARALAPRHPMSRGRARFRIGNIFSLPFRPSTFDLLIDYGCLHHVTRRDTRRYLDGVLSVLKPGGYVLLSCFSTKFKHHPGERRTRDWLVHRGHYDRFFRKGDFKKIFGRRCAVLAIEEQRNGLHGFYHVAMQKKLPAARSGPERSQDA